MQIVHDELLRVKTGYKDEQSPLGRKDLKCQNFEWWKLGQFANGPIVVWYLKSGLKCWI